MAKKISFGAAPKMDSADAIELDGLKGKLVAIMVTDRKSVTTKFDKGTQQTDMNYVTLVSQDMKKPEDVLKGVLFQKYFAHLPTDKWFIGKIVKNEKGHWGMVTDGVDKKVAEPLIKFIEGLPEEVEPAF